MIFRIPSKHCLLGASLALMLQTGLRFNEIFGAGEILLILYVIWTIFDVTFRGEKIVLSQIDDFTKIYAAILFFIITPATLYSYLNYVPGSSPRDLAAYFFSLVIALWLPRTGAGARTLVISFLIVLFISVGVQYIFGGGASYYFSRFSGGAKNPNQLALYMATSLVFAAMLPGIFVRTFVVIISLFFGIISGSDAYLAFVVTACIAFFVLSLFPPRLVLTFFPLFLAFAYFVVTDTTVSHFIIEHALDSDQGNSRPQLALSAFDAWTDGLLPFIFGYGAGNYSGLYGAFGMAEAHNTIMDMATIAGIFGIFLFPVMPLIILFKSLANNLKFAPAVFFGLIIFSLFHFVGRQPVFWVSVIFFSRLAHKDTGIYRKPSESRIG